jgi:hypothetical protein
MAKGTIITLFILAIIASILLGINFGMKIEKQKNVQSPTPVPTKITPTKPILPSIIPTKPESTDGAKTKEETNQISYYSDKKCGFSVSFPTSYLSQKTENEKSVILTDPTNPEKMIAFVCTTAIPRPPVSSENIESIMLDGQPATIYHDRDQQGNTRDELIVKNPQNGLEIFIAGSTQIFKETIASFKFL